MKAQSVVLLLSLLLTSPAISQWTWLSPKPQGQTLNTEWFMNADTGIFAGKGGTILKTTDGGNSWNYQINGMDGKSSAWSECWFTNDSTGFMLDRERFIFKTNDGGESWELVHEEDEWYALSSLTFTDNLHGFAAGAGGLLLKTSDGGNSWTQQILDPPRDFQAIRFSSPQNGTIVPYWGYVYHTTDSGNTWSHLNLDNSSMLNGIHFASGEVGFIFGEDGVIFKTTDGGDSWILNQQPDSLSYLYMGSFDEDTLLLVGRPPDLTPGYQICFRSVDGGDNWSVIESPDLYSIFCLNNSLAYATGSLGSVYKSTNAGLTWNPLSDILTYNQISCWDFPSENVGFASMFTDEYAKDIRVLKTIDGGDTWFPLDSVFGNQWFWTVDFPSETVGYIAGENIYRTMDGGDTWTRIYQAGWEHMIHSLSFPIASRGIAAGENGLILRTTNLGFTWTQIPSGTTKPLQSVCMLDLDTGFICGNQVFLKTTDGGTSWDLMSLPYNMSELSFLDTRVGYIAAANSILKTEDGGNTWANIAPPNLDTEVGHISFYDKDTGYAAGGTYIINSLLLKTTDGGATWTEEELPTNYPLVSVCVSSTNKVFAGGWPGFMFVRSGDSPTGIGINGTNENKSEVKCFPNPFHSSVTITYSTEDNAVVNLMIYDLSGKLVSETTEHQKSKGHYKLIIDGSALKPGIYFYKLGINNRSLTGRLVLLK